MVRDNEIAALAQAGGAERSLHRLGDIARIHVVAPVATGWLREGLVVPSTHQRGELDDGILSVQGVPHIVVAGYVALDELVQSSISRRRNPIEAAYVVARAVQPVGDEAPQIAAGSHHQHARGRDN